MASGRYDLVVLGAGSAGIAMAVRSARHGAKVALLEPGALGGTCVNVGCVPKKAMWFAAELAEAQKIAREVGFDVQPGALRWPDFVARRSAYIDNIHAAYRRRFEDVGVELIAEPGRFLAADRIATPTRELEAGRVLIATGAKSLREPIPGGELGIDSDGFFALRAAPRRVAIVGSGYIAVELAGVLRALGSEVTVVARGERLLAAFDHELGDALAAAMARRGIELAFRRKTVAVEATGPGYLLRFTDGSSAGDFDELIWATGRHAVTAGLDLERAGVALDAKGFVQVDDWQDTNVANVHAVGDVTGRLALTPVAVAAARRLADRVFGGKPESKLDYANVPTVVFAHPPIGSVGLGEEAARAQHGDTAVKVYRSEFRPMLTALARGEERTRMKLVCVGEDERVVGLT
jgi:glutathione reductase (NADPH)